MSHFKIIGMSQTFRLPN